MLKLNDDFTPPTQINISSYPAICKWILSALNKAVGKTVISMESYKFSDATSAVYYWWISQLCDVFIEAIKPYFFNDAKEFESEREASRNTLWICLDTGLRLLHPFMPFLTEELYQRLPAKGLKREESIMIAEYPKVVEEWTNEKIESEMEIVTKTVTKLRSMRPVSEKGKLSSFSLCKNQQSADVITTYADIITTLASVSSIKILKEGDVAPAGCAIEVINDSLSVYLQLQTLNAEAEKEKLKKKREIAQNAKLKLERKMEASGYQEKAKEEVRNEDLEKLKALMDELNLINELEEAINGAN